MPSIAYLENRRLHDDPREDGQPDRRAQMGRGPGPEPPARFDPDSAKHPVAPGGPSQGGQHSDFDSARRLITTAQVMAIVSLVIGGVLLSAASVVVAVIAYRKVQANLASRTGERMLWQELKRSSLIAIVMAVLALAASTVAFVMVYPMVMDMVQSGDYASLFNTTPRTEAPDAGNSTWG